MSEELLLETLLTMSGLLTAQAALWIGFSLLLVVMAIAVRTFRKDGSN